MRKTVVHALGILVPVLASPAALVQERPRAEPRPLTQTELSFRAVQLQQMLLDVRLHAQPELRALNQDPALRVSTGSRELVLNPGRGDTRFVVSFRENELSLGWPHAGALLDWIPETEQDARQELEIMSYGLAMALEVLRSAEPDEGLRVLDAASRATMGARRVLSDLPRIEPVGRAPGWERNGRLSLRTRGADPQSPLAAATETLKSAVGSLRLSADLEEARAALDEVDKALVDLRAVLWEEASKR